MKGENDILLGNSGTHQIFSNPQIGAIVLQPDFALDYVDVQKDIVYTMLAFSSDLADLIVSQRLITYELRPNRLFRGRHVRNLLQDALHDGSVGIVATHCTILS